MVSERLNGIALMHVHQEIVPNLENVQSIFIILMYITLEFPLKVN